MTTNEKNIVRKEYKQIADFLGWVYFPFKDEERHLMHGWFTSPKAVRHVKTPWFVTRKTLDLNFRFDYNRLMIVVEKIESLNHQRYGRVRVIIDGDTCTIMCTNKSKEGVYNKSYTSPNNKKKALYESILLFLDWYQNNFK